MELSVENATFDIKDTWLFMGLLAQREESEITKYIQEKKNKEKLSAQDIAAIEYASEIRSSLKETRHICSKKALQEKGGQYQQEALEKLLKWEVISYDEVKVLHLRTYLTYREIGKALGISASAAYNTVERVHERVKLLYKNVSRINLDESCDAEQLKKNAEKVKAKIVESKLSDQQTEIYKLMNKGYSDLEIRLKLNLSPGNYRYQKCQINKKRKSINIL